MIKSQTILALTVFSLILSFSQAQDFSQFEIVNVEKIVQLNGPYPIENSKVEYRCISSSKGFIYHALPIQQAHNMNQIQFSKDKQGKEALSYSKETYSTDGQTFLLFKISLGNQLSSGESVTIIITTTFLNRYINYPTSIDLSEDQKFQYLDSKRFVSPYVSGEQTVTYKFNKLIGFEQDGEKKGISTVSFNGLKVPKFSVVPHKVHGVNNEPQVMFSEVVREIEVSHWGNIAITEFYKIKNVGPQLKGQFSRVQFSSANKFEAKNAWRGIQTKLPYQIWGLYYRDEVGNISTSRAHRDHHNQVVNLQLVPRYSILGGWKANWQIGYNLNTHGFLTHDEDSFVLNKIPIEYALSKILAQKYTIRVILPEGSQNVKLFAGKKQVEQDQISLGLNFGYLDFQGRPTFTIQNLQGPFKSQSLKVQYKSQQILICKKPLLVFGAIFCILLLFIALKRINMSAFEEEHMKTQ